MSDSEDTVPETLPPEAPAAGASPVPDENRPVTLAEVRQFTAAIGAQLQGLEASVGPLVTRVENAEALTRHQSQQANMARLSQKAASDSASVQLAKLRNDFQRVEQSHARIVRELAELRKLSRPVGP